MWVLLTIIRNASRQSFCNRDTNLARQQTCVCSGGEMNERKTESIQASRGRETFLNTNCRSNPAKTINWTANHLKYFTSQTDKRGLASTQYTVPPTVVGNSHRQEGTNGLENLSAWHRDVLKPDLNHGKDCDTNTLKLLWKTKETKRFQLYPRDHFIKYKYQYKTAVPFWGLLTHPQRALDTDAQSWYTWVVLDFPMAASVDRGKEVLQKNTSWHTDKTLHTPCAHGCTKWNGQSSTWKGGIKHPDSQRFVPMSVLTLY